MKNADVADPAAPLQKLINTLGGEDDVGKQQAQGAVPSAITKLARRNQTDTLSSTVGSGAPGNLSKDGRRGHCWILHGLSTYIMPVSIQ